MIDFGTTPAKRERLLAWMERLGMLEEDLEESFVRSGGHGGQNVNKNATCVRLLHRPSGLEVKMQKARTQGLNRYYARQRLCELLEARQLGEQSPEAKRIEKLRKQKSRRRRRSSSSQ